MRKVTRGKEDGQESDDGRVNVTAVRWYAVMTHLHVLTLSLLSSPPPPSMYTVVLMTRGKRLSNDLRAVIVKMYTEDKLTIVKIAKSLNYPYSTIQGVLASWKHTGTVSAQKLKNRGRRRIMEYEDNQVCCELFHLILLPTFLSTSLAFWQIGMTYMYRK